MKMRNISVNEVRLRNNLNIGSYIPGETEEKRREEKRTKFSHNTSVGGS
jgi:hypothetical protein